MNMTEEEFWSCTPRKFFALVKQLSRFEGGGESAEEKEEKEPPKMTLKELQALSMKRGKRG